ncbi:hypothetical protein EBR43_10610 [bacterium]|nr:hypothetical protein [bacterium]
MEGAFQRTYSNVHKAIDALSAPFTVRSHLSSDENGMSNTRDVVDPALFLEQTRKLTAVFAKQISAEKNQPFKLFGLDATPALKPFAQTMPDRSFVHVAGCLGTPVAIGLQASVLIAIPEKKETESKWSLPLMVDRIPSTQTPCEIAEKQLKELARLSELADELCVIGADCGYTQLKPQAKNQVVIARSRIDRTGRRPHVIAEERAAARGRPRKYSNQVIHFAEPTALGEEGGPDEQEEHEGKIGEHEVDILISRWKSIIVHGREDLVDVVKIEVFLKKDPTKTLFENPMLCFMAYHLLYLVRHAAPVASKPWQKKRDPHKSASPSEVKRVFGSKIFLDLGSPSRKPLNRGKSKGRSKGTCLPPRKRYKPIKKQHRPQKAA